MKQFIIVIFALLCINVSAQNCYRLVWSDEFEQNGAPDATAWGYDLGNSGFGNNEVQNYTNTRENSRIENGILIIEAKKTAGSWTSARLKSQGKKSFTYGRIEFRAKLPAGSGTWPALWMLGENTGTAGWPACGEIDIMEHVGKNPGVVQAAMHTPSSYGNTQNKGSIAVNGFSSDFHIYAVEWSETKMDFYVDNNLYYTYAPSVRNDQTWPFNKPAFIIMNIAMGGNWGSDTKYETGGLKNGIDPALTSVRMEVDYVRYYNKTDKPKITGTTQIQDGQSASFSVPATPGASYNWSIPVDATITNGQNTNKIDVTWGKSSGNVALTMGLTCGSLELDPLPVVVRYMPSASVFKIYDASSVNIGKWQEVPSTGNSITLTTSTEMEVKYNISNPSMYPTIKYSFGGIADLSYYNYVNITLKTNSTNPPSIIRLDVFDKNGNYNSSGIFKITTFTNDNQYHTYSANIASVWPFSLSEISELRLYINFGAAVPASQGEFWLKDVSFSKEQLLSNKSIFSDKYNARIYPNPASDLLHIFAEEDICEGHIINASGQKMVYFTKAESLDISNFAPGFYSVIITGKNKSVTKLNFIKQ